MIDGLALGETTPGPLIMVVAFVGFVGGWTQAIFGADSLFLAGAVAAAVVTFFTFLPSFFFILLGGPFIESTHGKLRLHRAADRHHGRGGRRDRQPRGLLRLPRALAAGPRRAASTRVSAVIGVAAGVALFRFKVGVIPVVLVAGAVGVAATFAANARSAARAKKSPDDPGFSGRTASSDATVFSERELRPSSPWSRGRRSTTSLGSSRRRLRAACLAAFCTLSKALLAAATADFTSATAFSVPAGAFLTALSTTGHELACASASWRFGDLADFGVGRGGDFVHVAAIGGGLLGGRLQQAGLQGQQLLRVLDRQRGLGVFGGFGHRGLGDLQVQFDQLLDAFEGLAGQAEQGFDVGLVGGNDLFNGHHGVVSGGLGRVWGTASALCCTAT